MRKLTKLLAVIMVACLLCGTIAMTASAADEATKSFLDITNADKGVVTQKYNQYDGLETGAVVNDADAYLSNVGNIWDSVDKSIAEGVMGDKYLNLSYKGYAAPDAKSGFVLDINHAAGKSGTTESLDPAFRFFNGGADADGNVSGAMFLTVDFDIVATHYVFTINGAEYKVTEIKTDAEGNEYIVLPAAIEGFTTEVDGENRYAVTEESVYDLSYVPTNFIPITAVYNSDGTLKTANDDTKTGTSIQLAKYISIDKEDGKWVLKIAGSNGQGGSVNLSQKAGEWNHVTMVFKANEKFGADSNTARIAFQASYFLNGKYFGNCFKNLNSQALGNSVSVTGIRGMIDAANLNTESAYDNFSMGINNFAVTTYSMASVNASDYVAAGTITDLWSQCYVNNKAPTGSEPYLQDVAKDMVYNPDTYMDPNHVFAITKDNDATTTVRYATQAQLLNALKIEGNTSTLEVTSTTAIENFIPDVSITLGKTVYIYAPSVTLSDAAVNHNCVEEAPGKWLIKPVTPISVVFYDENGQLIEGSLTKFKPDQDPAKVIPAAYNVPVIKDGKYYNRVWEHEDQNMESDTFFEMIPFAAMDEATFSWYSGYTDADPMAISCRLVEDTSKTLITWLKLDGTEFKTEWYTIGDTLVHPTAAEMEADEGFLEKLGNGWYDKHYNGWVGKDGADVTVASANAVFVANAAAHKLVAAMDGIRYNFVLSGTSSPRVFAPVTYDRALATDEGGAPILDEEGNQTYTYTLTGKTFDGKDIPEGIEYLGFVDDTGVAVTTYYQKVGNDYLNVFKASTLAATSLGNTAAYVGFKVEGYEQVVIQKVVVGFEGYTKAILDNPATEEIDGAYACGSEEAVLALAILNFINSNSYANKGTEIDAAKVIMAEHTDCACKAAAEAIFDYSYDAVNGADEDRWAALKEAGVTGINYLFTLNQPSMVVQIPTEKLYFPTEGVEYSAETDSQKIYKLVFKYSGLNTDADEPTAYALTTYTQERIVSSDLTTATNKEAYYVNSKAAVNFRTMSVRMCNAAVDFTIELYNYAGELIASGNYSVADYIDAQNDALAAANALENEAAKAEAVATAEKAIKGAKGLYFFAQAAYDYKLTSVDEMN